MTDRIRPLGGAQTKNALGMIGDGDKLSSVGSCAGVRASGGVVAALAIALSTTTIATTACRDTSCEESSTCASASTRTFAITVKAPERIVVGSTIALAISVDRNAQTGGGLIEGEIRVVVDPQPGFEGGPSASSPPSLTIPADASTGTLSILVARDRKHGPSTIVVKASAVASNGSGEASADIFVRGAPGMLDTTFGADGDGTFTLTELPAGSAPAEATSVVVLADGRMLVGGRAGKEVVIMRLDASGKRDSSFHHGTVTEGVAGGVPTVNDLVVDSQGRALQLYTPASTPTEGIVARYDLKGELDASFGNGGVARVPVRLASTLVISPSDGSLFIAGQQPSGEAGQYVVKLRGSNDAASDSTFGGGTGVYRSVAANACKTGAVENCRTVGLIFEPQGGTLLAVQTTNDGSFVNRINAIDGSSGNLSALTTPLLTNGTAVAASAASSNYAFVGGEDKGQLVVRQLTAVGTAVSPFGNDPDNQFRAPIDTGLKHARRLAVTPPDEKLIIGADALLPNGGPCLAIARLTSAGTLDPTFGDGGSGSVRFQIGGRPTLIKAMAIDSANGRVVIAGSNDTLVAARVWL